MAPFVSDQQIQEIRLRNDIVEVVGAYLPLKRAGAAFRALCPFHNEKTPSFHVNPARQIFHCFGCGVGGDVFRFVMMYENLTFPEAIERLADRAGVVLERARPGERRRRGDRDELLRLHTEAADWFAANLRDERTGADARRYLESRGFPADWIEPWGLGCAPAEWNALLAWASRHGWKPDRLIQSGLVMESSRGDGRRYDRFRNRLIFPIVDETGRVVGFSGRTLDPAASEAKYINSPETPIFTKGRLLFGLHRARGAIRDARAAIVCEGQLDVIRAQMTGLANAVAPLGTAFTDAHARLLARYADEIILLFDADAAGQRAAVRAFDAVLATRLSARVARLPEGHDPDSLLREHGPDPLQRAIAEAVDIVDHHLDLLTAEHDLGTGGGRMQIAAGIVDILARVDDPVARDAYLARAADRTGLRRDALESRTSAARRPGRRGAADPAATTAADGSAGPDPERILLRLFLDDADLARECAPDVPAETLSDGIAGRLLRRTVELCRNDRWDGHLSLLAEAGDDDRVQGFVAAELAADPADLPGPERQRIARDCLDAIERRRLRDETAALKRRIVDLSADPDETDALRDAHTRLHELLRRERALRVLERNLRTDPIP